jgi:hypothetical protein
MAVVFGGLPVSPKPKMQGLLSEQNELIECPTRLYTDDGRVVDLVSWSPTIEVGSPVRVEISGFIRAKREGE